MVINSFSQAQSNYADGGFDKEAMDKIILKSSENNFMGNLSLFQNGVEIYNNSTGYKDRKNETLTDEKTRFRIGSISKIFTEFHKHFSYIFCVLKRTGFYQNPI